MTIDSYTVNLDPGPPGSHHQQAMADGADCGRCSLRNCGEGPVPPSLPNEIEILVVAEAPGQNEVNLGQTLVGPSGREIRTALRNAGADPARTGFTNATLCRCPGGDLKKYLQQIKRQGIPSPIECCRPRLQNELKRARFAVLMGGASLSAVGINTSITKVRGTPVQIPNGPLAIPILHAAFVLREEGRTMRGIFHADVTKAVRISRGGSTWRDPAYFVPTSADQVANFLAAHPERLAVDVETDGKDSWTCNLRRVGIGNATEVMIYSPLSVKGHWMLPAHEIQAQSRAIAEWLQRAPRVDLHNGIAFDSVVLWRHGMPLREDSIGDTMIAHQIGVTSELPHRLDFLGSIYTDAPYWKDSVKHSNVRDDATLDRYLSYDIAVTYTSAPYVEANLTATSQQHIYSLDAELFRIGRSMACVGLGIDHVKRMEFAREYQEKSNRLLAEFKAVAGRDINPGSYPQVRKLLYEDLGLPMLDDHFTDSGEASTDENTLLDLLELGLDERASKIIHGLIGYREAEKILGTNTGHVNEKGELEGGPPVHADGRVRTGWRPGKTSGRWGSSDPINAQNIGKKLRAMFVPAPGNVFVAADMQAIELRMIALLSGDEPLIQAFQAFDEGRGPDVHVFNACTVFKCKPEEVTDVPRNFIKRFVYALNYGAEPPKIFQTLSLLRDDDLKPLFPNITLPEVERLFSSWWKLHPAMAEWRKGVIRGWRQVGFIATQFHKRKRFFLAGESPTEMANFPIQGPSADLQNDAIRAVVNLYPYDYANHRGLIINGHDQIVVECAQHEGEAVKRIIQQSMQRRVGAMLFPADPKVATNWKEAS